MEKQIQCTEAEMLAIQREIAKLMTLSKKQSFPMNLADFTEVKNFMIQSANKLNQNKLYLDMAISIFNYLRRVNIPFEEKARQTV